ncbi:MAG: Tic22 family protein [Cyanobacteria bacterium J06626_18]
MLFTKVNWAPMKGVIDKLTPLSLASVALSGLALLPQSALALTEQQILEKLNNVPVFLIVNGEGQSLTASVNNEETEIQVPIVFINSAEAENFLTQAESDQAEFAGDANIAVLPLSELYTEASVQLDGPNSLVYIPSTESVDQASDIVNTEVQGVPLFAAVNAENDQYLLTNNETLPMFFSLQDLQAQLSPLIEQNPDLEGRIDIDVVSFEAILENMSTNDSELNQLLELIQFVPSSQTLQYIQSLPTAEEAAPEEAAPEEASPE